MAPRFSTLAWNIPWMEEPGRLQSMGLLRVRHNWATSLSLFTFMHWRRKWQPTPVFLPGESQGLGSLVGCGLWGRTESDTTEATQQQQQCIYANPKSLVHPLPYRPAIPFANSKFVFQGCRLFLFYEVHLCHFLDSAEQYCVFVFVWFISHSIIISRSIHVAANVISSFFL